MIAITIISGDGLPEFILKAQAMPLVLPFGTTARNLHLVDLMCCQALA